MKKKSHSREKDRHAYLLVFLLVGSLVVPKSSFNLTLWLPLFVALEKLIIVSKNQTEKWIVLFEKYSSVDCL